MHELIVLSDLHMGRGINPETRRFFTLENFFFDDDFAKLCDFLCRDAAARATQFKLIFNGDTFDLLRIDAIDEGAHEPHKLFERRFGPALTPLQAAKTIADVLRGHPSFVRGIAQVLNAGHAVVFLPGNHDIEMQWAPVQQEVRNALIEEVRLNYGEQAAQAADGLIEFRSWFYHEPQRIWIEHGCQYDPENSFRYLLRGSLKPSRDPAPDPGSLALPEEDISAAYYDTEQDMPLGNFFQRYLYNAFGHITFIVPSTRANGRYFKWLIFNAPTLLLRVVFSHGPFVYQVFRRLSRQATQRNTRRALEDAHQRALEQLAESSGMGEKLFAIDGLKEVRADAVQAARSYGRQAFKFLANTLLFGTLVTGLWFSGWYFITELAVGVGPKVILFLLLTLLLGLLMLGALLYSVVGGSADVPPRPLRRAAQRLTSILDVPVVSFGHSHDEEIWRLERPNGARAWYCNTGTWIAVFTHDVLIPRDRVQYTFLRVHGEQAELMHWSPERNQPMPVVLLDEQDAIL